MYYNILLKVKELQAPRAGGRIGHFKALGKDDPHSPTGYCFADKWYKVSHNGDFVAHTLSNEMAVSL
jgi:hypothetical protein